MVSREMVNTRMVQRVVAKTEISAMPECLLISAMPEYLLNTERVLVGIEGHQKMFTHAV